MKTRLISIGFMLPFLVFLFLGKTPLFIVCFLVSAFALFEFFKGFEKLEIKSSKAVGFALLLVLYAVTYFTLFINNDYLLFSSLINFWFFLGVLFCLILIITNDKHNILGPSFTLIGVLYIGFTLIHESLIERIDIKLAWLPIIIGFMSDTGGYFGGMYFGKHKLSPALSPKKTIEGSIVGIIFGALSCLIFTLIFIKSNIIAYLIMGIIGSVIAELGDLVASSFKRKMGIKDFSNLIPGHGGVLDRIDSLLLLTPFVYYYIVLFID